jgi:hypothetical protein
MLGAGLLSDLGYVDMWSTHHNLHTNSEQLGAIYVHRQKSIHDTYHTEQS